MRVEKVHNTLKQLWHLIELSYLTWRDTVVHIGDYQRIFLEAHAIMDYDQIILPRLQERHSKEPVSGDPRWLGGLTIAPLLAERLASTGVPVWLVRHIDSVPEKIIIQDIVKVREPAEIVIANYVDPVGHFAWPFEVEYEGLGGDKNMHRKIREATYRARDLVPDDASSSQSIVLRTTRQGTEGWQPCESWKRSSMSLLTFIYCLT